MNYKDYYEALGVDKKAGEKEIKSAYRKLVKKYHPDKTKGDKNAESRFKEIAEAYEVLSDPEKRQKYDELGANWDRFGPGENWQKANTNFYGFSRGKQNGGYKFYTNMNGHDADFSDFFKVFFGGFDGMDARGYGNSGFDTSGFGSSARGNTASTGNDVESEIRLSVEEAYNGITAQVNVDGSTLKIKIPAGVKDGQKIRVAGKGQPGMRGGKSGDLYLVVRINEHKLYKIDGADIKLNVPITPSEAALGAKIQVPTPKGKISLTVPPGTSSGKVLRLKGLGLGSEKEKGNLLVTLDVAVPPDLTEEERELYRKLQDISNYNPREKIM
ncbi:DnaJ C-terminal domain-containing protein [Desulfitibacter alkalitolerans]|uniref:DnaJ C-terminal domain-containing protein n=1 Tax=Desulfitibacter alkalitolerans TaxID=264641 RepID=UPI00048832A9|nr:J domain-containing protein [Desulfitibacter alkalitolerans]